MEKTVFAFADAERLLRLSLPELILSAHRARKEFLGDRFELCGITNAKSGLCAEDCKFCAQSARHATGAAVYPLKTKAQMVDEAKAARDGGAERFGIVTSGRGLDDKEVAVIAGAAEEIRRKVGIKVCASLGVLSAGQLACLKAAGVTRYHHNLETSPRHFPNVVTTHGIQERIETVRAARAAGLEVCSGGIIGLGEDWQDRIELALLLKELDVDSVPINVLVPIKGTPLAAREPLSPVDAIRTICLFRLILPEKTIRLAAGRETVLGDFQALAFLAGANGMLIGGYLTVRGREIGRDLKLVEEVKRMWGEGEGKRKRTKGKSKEEGKRRNRASTVKEIKT